MFSGALLVGNVPPDREGILGSFMVELDVSMSDSEIVDIVNDWFEDEAARVARATAGYEYARAYHNERTFFSAMTRYVNMYKRGERGMIFPHGVTVPFPVS